MKTIFGLAVVTLFLTPGSCFALWVIAPVSPEVAEDLGIEVRVTGDPDDVTVELEFGLDQQFKDFDGVNLRIATEGDSYITAPLREERPADERVLVSFSTPRNESDTLSLWIMVPGGLGGTIYELSVDDFVD